MIKKHIPNTITCCNLISGSVGAYCAFQGKLKEALLFIVIGAVFDFFDGFAARLLKTSSAIGKELDSLADDITFGLAPAAILFSYLQHSPLIAHGGIFQIVPYVAFVMAAFSAIRLAKFNLDERQTMGFIGLPTPANALFWGSICISTTSFIEQNSAALWIAVLVELVSCKLLVAEFPMFALKFKSFKWKDNKLRFSFIFLCVILLILFKLLGFALSILGYIILSMINNKVSIKINCFRKYFVPCIYKNNTI